MALSIGIVGLPNVGKSTLFNALTQTKGADAANFPFCTIEPNKGIVSVPDERIDVLSKLVNAKREVYAAIEFIDIAGLVEGASKGEGLGNQFLATIREVDAICQVVRVFEDGDVTHVAGAIDPKRDIDIIQMELIIKDLESIEKRIGSIEKKAQSLKDKDLLKTVEILKRLQTELGNDKLAINVGLEEEEIELVKDLHLLTLKPFIYLANVNEGVDTGDLHEKLGVNPSEVVIPMCVKIEQELSELPKDEREMFLEELGMNGSALDNMIKAAFTSLKDYLKRYVCQSSSRCDSYRFRKRIYQS